MSTGMMQTMYKPNARITGLVEIVKTKELFINNEHVCSYTLKCEKGFGHTLGVAIRRTVLSSTEGVAPVAMKVNDAQHLFASVSGVKSSVLDISLQLQKVAFKFVEDDLEYCFLSLKKKAGAGGDVVYASDFEKSRCVVVVNGDLPLCSLDNGGEINLQIILAKGVGYVPFPDHVFYPHLQEGFFALDTFFSPGINCGYIVEHNTSGKNVFDSVFLNITTNGAVSPDEILKFASNKLCGIFKTCVDNDIKSDDNKQDIAADESEAILSSKVEDFDELSQRSKRCLLENNIYTIAELVPRTEIELRSLKGFGDKSLNEVKDLLGALGLQLGKQITKKRKI